MEINVEGNIDNEFNGEPHSSHITPNEHDAMGIRPVEHIVPRIANSSDETDGPHTGQEKPETAVTVLVEKNAVNTKEWAPSVYLSCKTRANKKYWNIQNFKRHLNRHHQTYTKKEMHKVPKAKKQKAAISAKTKPLR